MIEKIILAGNNKTIGEQHGEHLKEDIRETYEIYREIWRLSDAQIASRLYRFKETIRKAFPQLTEEITGIARSASVNESVIYAINSRTELISNQSLLECTAAGITSFAKGGCHTVLAQNWDWVNTLRSLTKVIQITYETGKVLQMLIEPGMVGKIGFNGDGVGTCLNFLPTQYKRVSGIPVHVMLRGILECSTSEEAASLVSMLPRASSANYLVGDIEDGIYSLETTPEKVNSLQPKDGLITHTNSYNGMGEVCLRQQTFEDTLRESLERHGKISPEKLKQAFKLKGVCAPPSKVKGEIETIHTIILNLHQRKMLVSEGSRSDEFKEFYLN